MITGIIAGQLFSSAPPALNVSGVYSDILTSSVPIPSGAQVGDLLVLVMTRGSTDITPAPTGFTSILESVSGTVCTRTMQAGDVSFSFVQSVYATIVSVRREIGSPTIDAVSTVASYISNQTFQTPTVTPTETADLALMIFLAPSSSMNSPAPSYNNLIPYNRSGAGGCGMAISNYLVPTADPFAGTSCGGRASTVFPAAALTILLK